MDNLNFNTLTEKWAFCSREEIPWHKKGQIKKGYQTSEEVIIDAQLNCFVGKLPNTHKLPDGTKVISENSFFTYRTDSNVILGDKIGPDYTVVQNRDAFRWFDELAGKQNIKYETAGALGKGGRIFITAKLPSHIKVGGKDVSEMYLFMTISHDGSGSIVIGLTPIRIVCNNTLTMALKSCTTSVKLRHTPNVKQHLNDAARVLKMIISLQHEISALQHYVSFSEAIMVGVKDLYTQ